MPRDITRQIAARRARRARLHHRRGRRFLRRLPGRARARLSRHLLEILQGPLQVDRQRDARREMERGRRRAIFITGEDLTCQAGPCRAAGSRARRAASASPMPSATAIIMSTALARRRPPKRSASSPRIPISTPNDGGKVRLAIHDGDLLTGSLTAPGFATPCIRTGRRIAPLARPKTILQGAVGMTTQRLGLIMNGVTGRMGLNQHLIRSIVAIREQGGVALAERRPRDARSDPGRPRRRQGRGARQALQHRALDHRSRQGARRQERRRVLRRRHHAGAARRC